MRAPARPKSGALGHPAVIAGLRAAGIFRQNQHCGALSDSHFQQAMGIDFDTTRLGILMSAFLLSYGFSSVF